MGDKKLYLSENEKIASIAEKLKNCGEKEITLIIPKRSVLLQNVENLKFLKEKAEKLNKNVSIIVAEGNMPGETIKLMTSLDSANISKTAENDFMAGNSLRSAEFGDSGHNKESALFAKFPAREGESIREKTKVRMFDIRRKPIANPAGSNKEEKKDVSNDIIGKTASAVSGRFSMPKMSISPQSNFPGGKKAASPFKHRKLNLLPSLSSKFFTIFILICFLTAGVTIAFILPKADVSVVLKSESESYDFEFLADENVKAVDAEQNEIPAKKIEISGEETASYPSTGKKHLTSKASGQITVYNEYSSVPQKIVASTRFLSKEGHLFRVQDSIVIPGFSRIEGKDIPGETVVTVYADKPGDKYNVNPTSFTLPGLQGTAKYSGIYARSIKPMSGGADKEVSYFSEADYITAKEKLIKLLDEKSEQDFTGKISPEDILLADTKQKEDTDIKQDCKVGDVADNFKMTASSKISALTVARQDLENLIAEKMKSKLGDSRKLVEKSRKYEIAGINKNEKGKIIMHISVGQNSVAKIDTEKIKSDISGKNEEELNSYFREISGIKSANINFWPIWVKNIPLSRDKINITIDTDNSL